MKLIPATAFLLGGALWVQARPAARPPADPALYQRYFEISRLAEAGRNDEALTQVDSLIKARPDTAAAYALRARLLQQAMGKPHDQALTDAEKDLRRAVALEPEEALYARDLGELLVGSEPVFPARREEAAALLERAASLDPLDAQARTILFYLRREQGKPAEALKAGRAAIKLSAQNLRLRLDTATLLAENGEKSEAVNQWIVVLRRGYGAPAAEAAERLRRQLRAGGLDKSDELRIRAALHEDDPADAGITRDYAAALLDAGRPAEALAVVRAAQAAPGTDPRGEKLLLTVAWQAGRLDLALAQAEALMQHDPTDSAIAQSAALLRSARGDFAGALALFNGPELTGAKLNPAALRVKALALLREKRTAEGLALLASQSRDPESRLQWFTERCRADGRATSAAEAMKAGLPEEAADALARLFNGVTDPALIQAAFSDAFHSPLPGSDPKNEKVPPAPTGRQAARLLNALRDCAPASAASLADRGQILFGADADFSAAAAEAMAAAGRPAEAIAKYEALREVHPDDPGSANNLAYLLLLHQPARLAEAVALAGEAVARDPENASDLDTLAWAHHLNGRDELAQPLLEQALRNGGRQAVVVAHLAVLRAKAGDAATARDLFTEARALAWTREERRDIAALAAIIAGKPAIKKKPALPAPRRNPAKKSGVSAVKSPSP